MIAFELTPLHAESSKVRLNDPIEVLLGVVADARFQLGDYVLLSMSDFPIVELAAQLEYWLKDRADSDFSYDSAEAEDELLWIRKVEGRWFVGSDLQNAQTRHETTRDAAVEFARAYIDRVTHEVKRQMGVDVSPALRLRK